MDGCRDGAEVFGAIGLTSSVFCFLRDAWVVVGAAASFLTFGSRGLRGFLSLVVLVSSTTLDSRAFLCLLGFVAVSLVALDVEAGAWLLDEFAAESGVARA